MRRGGGRALGHQRADQAALAARGQLQRFFHAVVRHQRADRAEGFDVVHRVVGQRLARQQQRGREEGAVRPCPRPPGQSRRRRHRPLPRPGAAAPRARPRRPAARARPARPSSRPRPTGRPPPPWPGARAMRSATASRCWRGTMARRMAVHFWPALTVISRATSLTNRSNSSSSGVTSGARMAQFSESASALNGMLWRTTFGCTRSLAAVSAEPVKVTTSRPSRRSSRSPVEPITSCSAPAGRMPESLHDAHHRLGQVAGGGGGLADAGHAGQEAGRELFQQAPDREVEGVDVHRHAAARHQDVRAAEQALLAQVAAPGLRGSGCRWAARPRPRWHRRTACRCRLRCRSSRPRAWRRCGPRWRTALPCARPGTWPAPSAARRAAGNPAPAAPAGPRGARSPPPRRSRCASAWVWATVWPLMALRRAWAGCWPIQRPPMKLWRRVVIARWSLK